MICFRRSPFLHIVGGFGACTLGALGSCIEPSSRTTNTLPSGTLRALNFVANALSVDLRDS